MRSIVLFLNFLQNKTLWARIQSTQMSDEKSTIEQKNKIRVALRKKRKNLLSEVGIKLLKK